MPSVPQRARCHLLCTTFGLIALAASALAQAQSGKTIRLLVGFPAGGGTDAIARILAENLKDELGAAIIVENKPGAGRAVRRRSLQLLRSPRASAPSPTSSTTIGVASCVWWCAAGQIIGALPR